ncbi:MAG: RagB/SusD family nutrient uptake outer membrane protein, partial [Bacteroidaceae bacterium]|nr:RagB/SusD family nutrient uptake outer membrane protein [Bacteroidaceae bacterium]
ANLKLAQLWGEIPVFTEEGGSTTERQSLDKVFAQIIKDLTDAESLLLNYNGDPRIPSKQAAQALLARTYLVLGDNPLTYDQVADIANRQTDPEFTTTPAYLEKAVEYADKVINSGLLALAPDFSKLFGRDYESNKLGQNEHLFTIAHDGDKVDAQGNHQTHCSWTFPFQNGQNGKRYSQNHTEVADDDLYDDWKAEQPNDKRLAKTYLTEVFNPEDSLTYKYYSPVYTPVNGKGVDQSYENSENLEIKQNSVDRIEIRFAEVLLIKAEALVQLGRVAEAVAPFNQLRTRAGIASVTANTLNLEVIKREWDYEFTYEQFSLYNNLRWKDLITSVKKVSHYKHFADDWEDKQEFTDAERQYFEKVHNHLKAKYNNVKGRNYRQPIPLGLSREDLGIAQNPGF